MESTNPSIQLVLKHPDGHCSEATIEGISITRDMLDAAEDLLHTLTTGERPVIKNFYDLVTRAFGTTHEEAKRRILAATYGMSLSRIDRVVRSGVRAED